MHGAGYSPHIEIVIGTKSRSAKTRHASERVPLSKFHKPPGIHSRIREFGGPCRPTGAVAMLMQIFAYVFFGSLAAFAILSQVLLARRLSRPGDNDHHDRHQMPRFDRLGERCLNTVSLEATQSY
jgi:hypothetical protein